MKKVNISVYNFFCISMVQADSINLSGFKKIDWVLKNTKHIFKYFLKYCDVWVRLEMPEDMQEELFTHYLSSRQIDPEYIIEALKKYIEESI